MKTSIHYSEEICKRLEAKKLTETISPYAMEYINTIMLAIIQILQELKRPVSAAVFSLQPSTPSTSPCLW